MTFKEWFITILAILCIPLEIVWDVLCIVPGVLAIPVCILLDHVEHKRGKRGYAVTGMVCILGRLLTLPRRVFTRTFKVKDAEMENHLKLIQDIEEKGL